jgi:glycosyltransferase involved in cell wall biosynthesis
MRILFLSRWYPYPPDNGSKVRIWSLLRALCERHQVTLVSFVNAGEGASGRSLPEPAPKEVYVCAYREFRPQTLRALMGYLRATPRYLVDTYSPEMEALIQQAVGKVRYDLVIASQLTMASYFRCFRGIPAIFEEAELGAYWPYQPERVHDWKSVHRRLTWAKHGRFVARLLKNFDMCTVVSETERKLLATAAPRFWSVHVIPNCVDLEQRHQNPVEREPGSLIFAGSLRFAPNRDAMTWFLTEVYPAIRAELPRVHLKITGDPGPVSLRSFSNVQLTGRVNDIRSLVAKSAVSLAPIRSGGGTRLKILEAIALRTPVVATSKAVEGLEVRDGEHLHIADTPRDFSQAVLRLLREPDYARRIADNAFRLLQVRYDRRLVLPRFMHLVEQIAGS